MTTTADWYEDDRCLLGELEKALRPPQISGYDDVSEIGRGAQGVVYEATQKRAGRKVAIKVLPKRSRRGLRELKLAARLAHPNIVRIYESGETADGRLFFVMEHIDGVRLDAFALSPVGDPNERIAHDTDIPAGTTDILHGEALALPRLASDKALRLAAKICDAVNHAHQRGVIHRDLKPGNILIDEAGEPHVLDFGVAIATDTAHAGMRTVVTEDGHFVGTLAYASPEQVSGAGRDLDVRTDVYSLGVILYQMLTGRLPVRASGPLTDVVRAITSDVPAPPSSRRNKASVTSGERINALARTDDVDAIVLRALAKDPERRYQTPGAMAADIRRTLAGEPIEARRDSTLYAVGKALQRYKRTLAVCSLFAVVVTASAIALSILYHRAESQANLARDERDRARVAEQAARRNLYVAHINLAQQALERSDLRAARRLLFAQWPKPKEEDLRDFDWHYLWQQSRGTAVRILRGHAGEVRAVACSPDGETIATASPDGTINLWNLHTGEPIATFIEPGVWTLAFSPDGSRLAAAGRQLALWDLTTHQMATAERGGFLPMIRSVVFSPNGKLLATAHGWEGRRGELRLWDSATLDELREPVTLDAMAWQVAISPDDQIVATATWSPLTKSGEVVFWNPSTGLNVPYSAGPIRAAQMVAFSRDFATAVTASPDGTITVWNRTMGRVMRVLHGPKSRSQALAMDPTGRVLACALSNGVVTVWDVSTGQALTRLVGHEGPVYSVAFSPDGSVLITGGRDKTARVWDLTLEFANGQPIAHALAIHSIAFDPRGGLLATASDDTTIKLWDTESESQRASLRGHTATVSSVVFSPDGRLLASGSHDGTVRLWDTDSAEQRSMLLEHVRAVYGVAFSPDGQSLAAGGAESEEVGFVRIWDVKTGRERANFQHEPFYFFSVAYSPDGKWLAATGGVPGIVRVWDLSSGTDQHFDLLGHPTKRLYGLGFSPDGTMLAAGGDRRIVLWDVGSGSIQRTISCRTWVYQIAFSPGGKTFATTGDDPTVTLWDVATGYERLIFKGHTTAVRAVAFSPRGNELATASLDGEVRRWRGGDQNDRKRQIETAELLDEQATRLLELGQYEKAEPVLRDVLQVCRRELGERHLWTARAMLNLGSVLVRRAKPRHTDEGERCLLGALSVLERSVPMNHLWKDAVERQLRELYDLDAIGNATKRVQLELRRMRASFLWASEDNFLKVRKACQHIRSKNGGSKSLDALEHVVTTPQHWLIIGPFPGAAYKGWRQTFGPERSVDLQSVQSQPSGANPRWREVSVPIGGRVSLLQHLSPHSGNVESAIAYALSYIRASGGERITFRFTSSEGAKVWLNDEVIADHIGYRNESFSRLCQAEAVLRPGSNKLLVKIAHSNEQWAFNMDAVDADGLPARLTWSATPTGPQ